MLKRNTVHFLGAAIFILCWLISCTPVTTTPAEAPKQIFEQSNPYSAIDKSPMDVSYYPVNFPAVLMSGGSADSLVARVFYSRPQKNGRTIFGNEAPPQYVQQYGTYWRLGANESTEIEFFKPVTIKEQKIPKGRYIMYCIPYKDKWTIALNTNLFSWGLHADTLKDFARIEIPALVSDKNIEHFTMVFQPSLAGMDLIMAWDNVKAVLPISFKQ